MPNTMAQACVACIAESRVSDSSDTSILNASDTFERFLVERRKKINSSVFFEMNRERRKQSTR